jgi:Zn-dependent peptidase ImmA (M78 family)
MNRNTLKKKAASFRKDLKLSHVAPVDVVDVCKLRKINLIFKPFNRESFSGISMKINGEMFIIVNSSKTLGHQNFTIAHEFYHLFFEKGFEKSICKITNIEEEKEQDANHFAINFLVPDKAVTKFFGDIKGKPPISEIVRFESIFKVSHKAMLIKLQNMGMISGEYVKEIESGVINLAKEMEIDNSLYRPTDQLKIISDYVMLARKAYEEEKISIGKFEELLQKIGLTIENLYSDEQIKQDMEKYGDV